MGNDSTPSLTLVERLSQARKNDPLRREEVRVWADYIIEQGILRRIVPADAFGIPVGQLTESLTAELGGDPQVTALPEEFRPKERDYSELFSHFLRERYLVFDPLGGYFPTKKLE